MIKVYDLKGQEKGSIELPKQFNEEFRPNLIKRAVLAIQSHKIQKNGTKIGAGTRHHVYVSKRRHRYNTTYGYNRSRTPAKTMSRQGSRFNRHGANVPQAVGGRVSHPPRTEKKIAEKINNKERRKAVRSAISATKSKEIVMKRGHKVSKIDNFPLIIVNDLEKINKTKDVEALLESFGLEKELERVKQKKVRAGKGKLRGRKYKQKVGPMFVVSKKCDLCKAARNIAGVDVALVKDLNAELLSPGTQAGRLTFWSEDAIKELGEKNLFCD